MMSSRLKKVSNKKEEEIKRLIPFKEVKRIKDAVKKQVVAINVIYFDGFKNK